MSFLFPNDADIGPEVISGECVTVWKLYLTINQADFFLLGSREGTSQTLAGQYCGRSSGVSEMAEIYGELLMCSAVVCLEASWTDF